MSRTSQTLVELTPEDLKRILSGLYNDPEDLTVRFNYTIAGRPVVSLCWSTRPQDLEAGDRV